MESSKPHPAPLTGCGSPSEGQSRGNYPRTIRLYLCPLCCHGRIHCLEQKLKAGPVGRLSTYSIKAHLAWAEPPGCRQELEILRLSHPSGTVPLEQGVWCSSLLSIRDSLREGPGASAGFATFRSSRQDGPTLYPHKDEGRYRGGGGRPRNHPGEKSALSLGATTERLPCPSSHFLEMGCLCGVQRISRISSLFLFLGNISSTRIVFQE